MNHIELVPVEGGSSADYTVDGVAATLTTQITDVNNLITIPLISKISEVMKFRLFARAEGGASNFTDNIIIKRTNCDNEIPTLLDSSTIIITEVPFQLSLTDRFEIKEAVKCPVDKFKITKVLK